MSPFRAKLHIFARSIATLRNLYELSKYLLTIKETKDLPLVLQDQIGLRKIVKALFLVGPKSSTLFVTDLKNLLHLSFHLEYHVHTWQLIERHLDCSCFVIYS